MKSHVLTIGTLIGLMGLLYGLNKVPHLLPGLMVVGIIVWWYILLHNLYSKMNNNATGKGSMDIKVDLEEELNHNKDHYVPMGGNDE